MEQMKAHVYELHGQIYRRNVPLENISQANYSINAHLADAMDEDEYLCNEPPISGIEGVAESQFDNNFTVGQPSSEKPTVSAFVKYDERRKVFYSNLEVPSQLIGYVIGVKAKRKQMIQAASDATIKIPKKGTNSSENIEIYADAVHKVEHARDLLELEMLKARQKCAPTHFVSFPLTKDTSFCNAYSDLVKRIRACTEIPVECRTEDLYRPVEKIHLTICVLRLFTEEDERLAKKCIDELVDKEIIPLLNGEHKITVEFLGLDFFGENKSKAKVVYARAKSSILQKVANLIDETLAKTGLATKRNTPNVVLHMTILNAKHATVDHFDAKDVLSRFGKFNLPSIDLSEIRICMMNEVDPYTNGHPTIFSTNFD